MLFRTGPDRRTEVTDRPCGPLRATVTHLFFALFVALTPGPVPGILSHKNMTTIYPTALPSGGGEPNSDLDATQRGFDVYEAYQRALADEEVSTEPELFHRRRAVFRLIHTSRYPPL